MARTAKGTKAAAKKRRGRSTSAGTGQTVGVRVLPPMMKRIDQWAEVQDDRPSRPEAMRRLVEVGLDGAGPSVRQTSENTRATAAGLAGDMVDYLADPGATVDERAKRKRRLLKGPPEFREMRRDQSKPKR